MSVVLLTNLLTFDPEHITDWKQWAIALGAALVRAGAGAALDVVRRLMTTSHADDSFLPVLHAECGYIAFLTKAPANPDEMIDAGEAFALDGSPIDPSSGIACNHCSAPLLGARVVSGVWIA